MNVLESIRSRHRPASGERLMCSCGLVFQECDAAMAVNIGLELYDAITLSMGHFLNMKRILEEFIPRFEHAVALSEDHADAVWPDTGDPDIDFDVPTGGGEGS